ncbi:MAG: porin family protein [Bacteroidia bacterium]|nr:porin family protein [Bacteroidia bacterium]
MKTRLISFALMLMLSAPVAIAQSSDEAKISFAVLGGANFQNLTGKNNNGDKLENDMIVGFHVGVNIQIPVAPEFFFQPGLLFTTKGAENTYGSLTGTYKLSYIELPLNMVYKGLLGKGHILIGFGPYVAYGIGGKASINSGSTTLETDIEFKNVVELGDPIVPYVKAFDAGGNIFAGYELAGGIFLQLNGQLGMLKINPEDKRAEVIFGDKLSVKNTGFGLSFGYRF